MSITTMLRQTFNTLIIAICLVSLTACKNQQSPTTIKDDLTVAITFEPTSLDPSTGAASAIAEVVLYNIFETLTKIDQFGNLQPLLARSWQASEDNKQFTFELVPGITFHNGEPFNSESVKYSFERISTANKDHATFNNIDKIKIDHDYQVTFFLKTPEPQFPELLAQSTAIIVEPTSAGTNATNPIGTGPFRFVRWNKGSSVELARFEQFRNVKDVKLKKVLFRFITDGAAAVNAVLAHNVDIFFRGISPQNANIFANKPEFKLLIGNSSAKNIIAINHRRPSLDDVRVRQALSMAIDRTELINNVANGYATQIGSHYPPNAQGYVDTTQINPYDPERAKQLLKQAGIKLPLKLSLKLPPAFYARQSGEIVAEKLKEIGVIAKIEFVEWARWMDEVFTNKNFDLTIISHVEPYDLAKPASNNYYFGYKSEKFNNLIRDSKAAATAELRLKALQQAQILLAKDAVSIYLYNPQWITVANAKLKGVPQHFPIFANDLSTISWQ